METAVPPVVLLATNVELGFVPSYPHSKQNGSVTRTSTNILWIEGGFRMAHEGRLKDVPTLTVLPEPAMV